MPLVTNPKPNIPANTPKAITALLSLLPVCGNLACCALYCSRVIVVFCPCAPETAEPFSLPVVGNTIVGLVSVLLDTSLPLSDVAGLWPAWPLILALPVSGCAGVVGLDSVIGLVVSLLLL